ncbi:MAG: hypothetical protein LKJ17_12160 [Oscillospiraceae bacterium]|jgi:hypothetical protein|nr:hypothetical protein [Oscillospiraceae bacterium]
MLTNADITVFNKHYNEETRLDEWRKTQISGVNWYGKQAVSVGDNGLMSADQYIVRIPVSSAPDDKTFVTPEKYAAADRAALPNLWTLQNGDIVARGMVGADDPKSIPCKHFLITGWADNRRGSPAVQHWKVEGK